MKFYKRFPGDIIKKTSGLTMAQFGAYDRLIDWCYANEMPIDPEEVYTITHAMTAADRRDVDRVLAKFFTLTDAGYRQERIEEVIAEALPKIEAARANGLKGGRPVGSGKKPSGLLDGTEGEPKPKTIQSQTSLPTVKKVKRASAPPPEVVEPAVLIAAGFDAALAAEFIEHKQRQRAPLTLRAWGDHLRESEKAGWTPKAAAEKVIAKSWKGFEAKYVANELRHAPAVETPYARQMRERAQVLAPGVAAKAPGQPHNLTVIEADGTNQQKLIA